MERIIESILNTLSALQERIKLLECAALPSINTTNNNVSSTEDAICEVTEDIEQRISDIEDAICELTEG